MFSENDKISMRQLQALLLLDLFGTAVVTLPRQTAQVTGNDGWIAVCIGSIVMLGVVWIFATLGERYPHKTIVEISQKLLSKPIGFLLSLGLAVKLVCGAALELRIFCEMIGQSMLSRTPISVTAIGMLLVCGYVAAEGYECRARAGEVLVVLVFLPFLVLLLLAAFTADYSNLLPVASHSSMALTKGAWRTMLSFQGIEFLFLVYPYLERPKQAKKSILSAGIVLGIFMVLITLLTIAVFGEYSVVSKLFPVLQMMDSLSLPGSFLDRQDIFMLWFWVASLFASVSAALFFVIVILERLQTEKTRKIPARRWMLLVMVVVFVIAIFPQDIAQSTEWMELLKVSVGSFYLFFVPILLLLIDVIKRGKAV